MGGHLDIIALLAIALGLSMDALAVSVANGFSIKRLKVRHAVQIAFFFGLFQAVMPVIGWTAGLTLTACIQQYDHWVAFGLLLVVGVKMIWESRSLEWDEEKNNCLYFPTLLLLSLATSIDALAVGMSFAMLNLGIVVPVLIIGAVTFLVCFVGTEVGDKLGDRIGPMLGNRLQLAGGIVLILIGIKILIEHIVLKI